MRRFEADIIQFVHSHFERRVIPSVYQMIDELATPRVMRAVLFLSDGSIAQLKHYLEAARADVRQVLTWAECVVDIAPEPMFVRDLSMPFEA
ncbi:MAG TPA: hypothetical protein VMJ74_05350 [Pseudomonadales bacterium]|nr:hypothetical protein [Pseudomonadales bacterium]